MNSRTSAYRPVIPRAYASSKDVVARLIDQAGGTKQVAFRLGLAGPTSVQAYSDPATKTQVSFDQVRRLTSAQACAAAEDLAALAGGLFMPGDEAGDESIAALAARSAREFGEWLAAVLTGRPNAEQRRELDEVIRELIAIRAKLVREEGT